MNITTNILATLIWVALTVNVDHVNAQSNWTPGPINFSDPKGITLPPSVPHMIDDAGNVVWVDQQYTTKAYHDEALKLVLKEANLVATQLKLPETLPIRESDLVEAVVTPFGFNYVHQTLGNVTTSNYCYYVSRGSKFCYLSGTRQAEQCYKFQNLYTWPLSRKDTNEALCLAEKFLRDASMDVAAMSNDCEIQVSLDAEYAHVTPATFVPVYWITWRGKKHEQTRLMTPISNNVVGSVRLFTPAKLLLQLRVEDPRYILRRPLTITNLDVLMPGRAPVDKLPPPQRGDEARPG